MHEHCFYEISMTTEVTKACLTLYFGWKVPRKVQDLRIKYNFCESPQGSLFDFSHKMEMKK